MVLSHTFEADSRYELGRIAKDERNAIHHLLERESVAYTEAISVYVNPSLDQGYRFHSENMIIRSEGEHVVSVSFHNCCRKICTLPDEFRAMPWLRMMFYWQTPFMFLLADIGKYPSLQRFGVVGCPSVKVYCSEPHTRLKRLELRELGMHEIPYLGETAPRLEDVDFRDNKIESIENLDCLQKLKRADLKYNPLFSWLSPARYLRNRRKAREMREKGIEVLC